MFNPTYIVVHDGTSIARVVGFEDRCERWPKCECRVVVTESLAGNCGAHGGQGEHHRWSSTLGHLSACARFFRLKPP